MKVISALPHGLLDYAVGAMLVAAPWAFHFNQFEGPTYTMLGTGLVVLMLSLFTDYPLGLVKAVPFATHGRLERVGALFLLISPWLLHYSDIESARNLALGVGLAYCGVIALTNYSSNQTRRLVH
jgi:hypothetical protein